MRVVLVDDQTLVRRGIRSLLELAGDIEIVGEAGDGEEAIAIIRRERPDAVLLDVRMPRKSGIDVLKALHASDELPPTILLTTFDDDEALLEGVKAGARGYLLKDVSLDQLTVALRTVVAGGTLIRPAVTERVLRGLEHVRRDFESLERPDPLTKREVEILRLIAGGYSNKEIADALGTAEGTVKNHASSILSKLGVRDRTRAVLKALELGYI
jgi:DNA-binding NarL/FixJ family response regulator